MPEQITLFDEKKAKQDLFLLFHNDLIKAVDDWWIPKSRLECGALANKAKAIRYNGGVVCRYKMVGSTPYIEFPKHALRCLPPEMRNRGIIVQGGYIKIKDNFSDCEIFRKPILGALDIIIRSESTVFSCCSRYVECSNAKRCINPNEDLAIGCGYRVNLKDGKIFYGKNAINPK